MADRPIQHRKSESLKKPESLKAQDITADGKAAGKAGAEVSSIDSPSEESCPVVGVVASAGGLSAFTQFFQAMPADSGAGFVVVPHLDATHKSLMVELLSRHTSMPVVEAIDGIAVASNHVYVIPPNHLLTIEHGKLRLSDLPDPTASQTAIDIFLRSLAVEKGEAAVGIVFSGTGSHGTLGIREIKRCGGMAMAQSPESAEFDQMPGNAIETGLVDFVLPPEQMPETLLKYVQQPYVKSTHNNITPTANLVEQLGSIVKLVREQTKCDFSSYRKNMLLRRVERRMGLMQLIDMDKYLQVLREQSSEVQSLCKDFLISVTQFFREPEAFAVLEKEVIPALVSKHTLETPIRVWVPSCATGEEAYSISMLLFEASIAAGKPVKFQVFASDINDDSIEFARRGVYPASISSDLSQTRLKQFFEAQDDVHYRVNKKLRDSIVFSHQNLILDAPFSKIDLISCRNVLIYLEPEVQQKLISLFHFALNPHGFLFLGPSETIGREEISIVTVSKKWRVYRREGPANATAANLPLFGRYANRTVSREAPIFPPKKTYKELAENLIVSDYAPASALINQRHEILNVTGPLVNFLEFPAGEITKDLLELARPGLRTRLRAACHKAIQGRKEVTDVNARVKRDGTYSPCSITVRPVLEPNQSEGLMLVLFQDQIPDQLKINDAETTQSDAESLESATHAPLVDLLEYELKATREELRTTAEQMRCGIEELQSSNEELESSKEELQSLNEELNTVNSQLLEKVEELDLSNREISNLMASTEIATLFLDRQLRVKRFTGPANRLLHLSSADEGRSLQDLESPLVDQAMLSDCQKVLNDHQQVETEITTKHGQSFLRRALPFLVADSQAEGVVVTFVDLTERKRHEAKQREQDVRFRKVFENVATGIAITNWDGVFKRCNSAYCDLLGYTEEELRRTNFISLVHPEDQQSNRQKIVRLQSGENSSFEMESRDIRKNGETVWVRKFVSVLPDATEKPAYLVALVTNTSLQRKAVDELHRSEEKTRAILASLSAHIALIDREGVILATNPAWERFAEQNNGTMSRSGVGSNFLAVCKLAVGNADVSEIDRSVVDGLQAVLNGERDEFSIEYPCHVDNEQRWFLLQANPLMDGKGGAVISHHDISRRKLAEVETREKSDRLRTILNTATDAIITINGHGIIDSINQATLSLFGYTKSELMGNNVSMLMPLPFRNNHDSYIERFQSTGEARIIGIGREVICRRKDGSTFPADLAISQVGHLGLFTGILRDISSRKEMQKHALEIAAEEQRRIGFELHDGTQQELTGLTLYANALLETIESAATKQLDLQPDRVTERVFDEADYNRIRSTASLIAKRLGEANQHVRDLAHGIMPVQIDAEGLRSALHELVKSTNSDRIACRFECSGDFKTLHNTTATHLYRIAQEAINNAIRHAAPSQILISLTQDGDRISLEVDDDGIGFDNTTLPKSGPSSIGMGLRTMEYRASLIGGVIQIENKPDCGTLVRCLVLHEVVENG